MKRMNTRSAGKADFLMLDESRTPKRFKDDFQREDWNEKKAGWSCRNFFFGWACDCLTTRQNFVIGAFLFTTIMYVLAETTYTFEHVQAFLLRQPVQKGLPEEKSLEKFLDRHYLVICLIGPILGLIVAFIQFMKMCK